MNLMGFYTKFFVSVVSGNDKLKYIYIQLEGNGRCSTAGLKDFKGIKESPSCSKQALHSSGRLIN